MADEPTTFFVLNGAQQGKDFLALVDGSGFIALQSVPRVNDAPVDEANPLPVEMTTKVYTPAPGATNVIAAGGTPVTVFEIGDILHGAYITNPFSAPNGESVFISMVETPGTSTPGTEGTVEEIIPGQTWRAPGAITTAVKMNALTTGHSVVAITW
jgi:hypothetical protein